jgi:hypothetical protein
MPSGSYVEVWDLGTILASSKILLSCSREGSTVLQPIPTISTSADNVVWTDYPGVWEIFAVNFRYIKATLDVTSTTDAEVLRLYNINCLLNAKAITDAGIVSCLSSDTLGTPFNFNKEFIDVTSLIVSPRGTTPLVPVYDYQDAVIEGTYTLTSNTATVTAVGHGLITGQNVRLYFASGTAPSAVYPIVSYTSTTYNVIINSANTSGAVITYPQSARVYLFNNSGTRQTGSVSWSIKGY